MPFSESSFTTPESIKSLLEHEVGGIPAFVHDEEPPGSGAALFFSKRGKFEEWTGSVDSAIPRDRFGR